MAENPPLAPEATSSYSDPLYDRLEGVVNTLGRKWWIIVAVAILSAVITVMVVKNQQRSPEAASAAAYVDAQNDLELLEALVADESITAEFRAQAAIGAAQLKLEAGEIDAAEEILGTAKTQAATTGITGLTLAIEASLGAVAETRNDWDAARNAYNTVLSRSSDTNHPGINLAATLGAARVELAAAAESNDAAEALTMRRDARALLEYAAGETPDINYGNYGNRLEQMAQGMMMRQGSVQASDIDLGAAARFLLADLDRKHPEVRDEDAVAPTIPDEAASEAPVAQEPAAEVAPEEPAGEATPSVEAAPTAETSAE